MSGGTSSLQDSLRGHLNWDNQRQGLWNAGGQQWDMFRNDAEIFSGARAQEEDAAAQAAADRAASQRAQQQAQQMAAQMLGGQYTGGQASGGGGSGMMAAPVTVTPNQTPNMGLPQLQNQGQASRGDIAAFLASMRQGVPTGGYSPAMQRTVMPGPQITPPAQGGGQGGDLGGGLGAGLGYGGTGGYFGATPGGGMGLFPQQYGNSQQMIQQLLQSQQGGR